MSGTGGDAPGLPAPRVRAMVDHVPFLDQELFVLDEFLPVGGTMVDVGAAGGVHALVGARRVGSTGRVVAIEARPGSAAILRGWRTLLGLDQVTILSTAVGARPGSLELRTPVVPTRTHTDQGGMPASDGWLAKLPSRVRTVGMTTLDLVVASQGLARLDLIKVDVEGAELDVLAGGEQAMEAFRPTVVIEVEERHLRRNGRTAAEVLAWFHERDYVAHVLGEQGLVAIDQVTDVHNNYVCVPRSVG